ncbi:HEAT repeat domain-containing protein [Streptomyces sp. KHY 26]|uniref:HEAT repeat domain-containing protein n=1 Tax=Streptomyces sp. KHY 26 TaxID=3097359 RepID=UPI00376F1200
MTGTKDAAPDVRRAAVAALGRFHEDAVTDVLLARAGDSDRRVRPGPRGRRRAGRPPRPEPHSDGRRRTRTRTYAEPRTGALAPPLTWP